MYAGENIHNSGPRHDAIHYLHDGVSRIGILDHILSLENQYGKMKVEVVRRFIEIEPHPDNKRIVNEFGHVRMLLHSTDLAHSDITQDVMPESAVTKTAHVVPDYHDIAIRYTIGNRRNASKEERRLASFFWCKVFRFLLDLQLISDVIFALY